MARAAWHPNFFPPTELQERKTESEHAEICEKFEVSRARMGQGRGVHRVLVGRPEGKRQLGRPRRRWGDNIKMDLQEVGGGCEDWMELAQDRDRWRALVSTVMNLRVPKMRGIS